MPKSSGNSPLSSSSSSSLPVVPFLDLSQQFRELKPQIDAALEPIFRDTSFVLGPAVGKFEQAFAQYIGTKFCVSLHSGTAALHLALLALGIGPGDEVIIPANTFIATAEAVSFCGATPCLVDVEADTANIDTRLVEAAINSATRAIMPVHLYGQPADMLELERIARAHNLRLVEDASQAHGASFAGHLPGSLSDAACFSFYPGKNLGAAGEGGAVVTNSEELAQKITLLRNHGSSKKYYHEIIGHNFRLDSIQAAILDVKLPYLDSWNAKRREIAAFYDEALLSIEGIRPLTLHEQAISAHHLYVVKVANRYILEDILRQHGIGYGVHYPVPVHLHQAYALLGLKEGDFPVAEELCRTILSLPIYPELSREEQNRVVEAVRRAGDLMTMPLSL
jgi:dTDP-4-amino-4,6-dideoxygalactose transaminase